MEKKVGLITFHASYNFGTVMQAWALQSVIENLGYSCSIINFRMKTQKDKYSLFPIHGGWKLILRNLLQIGTIAQKYSANKKYESFINEKLHVTSESNTIQQLRDQNLKFDIYVSGSDQIWAHSIPEFTASKEDVRGVYFLDFVEGYKISYASSTGQATYEQLLPYKEDLEKYSYIAVREERGKELLERLLDRKVETVLDPTFLISHSDWVKYASELKALDEVQNLKSKGQSLPEQKYGLIYTLQGRKKNKQWQQVIDHLSKEKGLITVTVSPFAPIDGENIVNRADAGPEEILQLFANAEYILTDTFHGMSFSIHFRKPFVLFEEKEADFRKKNVLGKFDLMDRVVTDPEKCLEMLNEPISYELREEKIQEEVKKSLKYLEVALLDSDEKR